MCPGNTRDEEVAHLKRELAQMKREREFFARRSGVLREGIEMRIRSIDDCRKQYPSHIIFRCLRVSLSGYYARRNCRPQGLGARENAVLSERIEELHEASERVKGSPCL